MVGIENLTESGGNYIIDSDRKILIPAKCFKCGKDGMAYVDPSTRTSKPHFCIECNPMIVKAR